MTLLQTLTVLALADGVHLVAIGALAFLLTGAQPLPRAVVFMAALLAAHLAGGVLLVVGWGWVVWAPPVWWVAVEWAVVAVLVVLAVWRVRTGAWRQSRHHRPPRAGGLPAVALAGVVVSAADLAFDIPYHLAAARITDAVPTLAGRLGWLVWFNLVYAVPMVAAAMLVVAWRRRVERRRNADEVAGSA